MQQELMHLNCQQNLIELELDKIDVDKLRTVPVDLSKLRNVVNNGVVKKTVYNKLVAKVNSIDTSVKYDIEKSDLEKKISDANKKNSCY